MPQYREEPAWRHGTPTRTGILLVNLGTPDAPTPAALRRYLAQFLSDTRVVELPRTLWLPLLYGVVLRVRPKASAAKYASIWTEEGSPLRVHTARQAERLAAELAARGLHKTSVEYGMRYGSPSVDDALERLKAARCDRILLLPLYPQYAASTTASSGDALFQALRRYRDVPAVRTVRHFHDHPRYIGALADAVRAHWDSHGRGDRLLMSFHGVPRVTLLRGDPYHCECHKTARMLAEALGLGRDDYVVAFQSLFGRAEWLRPYTAEVLADLGRQKVGRVDVMCPGFVADCLETLEEIAIEGKHTFLSAGGGDYRYIGCLNEHPVWIAGLADIALEQLGGWLDRAEDAPSLDASRTRALALGADD